MEIGHTIAEMLVDKFSEVPKWIESAACAQQSDLDPFYAPDQDAFIEKVCGSCPFRDTECAEYTNDMLEAGKDITSGVFHGEKYD